MEQQPLRVPLAPLVLKAQREAQERLEPQE